MSNHYVDALRTLGKIFQVIFLTFSLQNEPNQERGRKRKEKMRLLESKVSPESEA